MRAAARAGAAAMLMIVAYGFGPSASAAEPPGTVVITGHGWGHGVGMPQDGAYALGRAGFSTNRILGQFYPGTALGRAAGSIRVALGKPVPEVRVSAPNGATVRAVPAGSPTISLPASSSLSLAMAGGVVRAAQPHGETVEGAGADGLWVIPSDGGTTRIGPRAYRGVLHLLPTPAGIKVVNQLDVEEYLRGMGEVRDASWPAPGLRAQAIAARTFALRAMSMSGEICDDDRCQVYLGQQVEYAAMSKAVADTRGMVLVYRGRLAATYYSANGGGTSATAAEGFGGGDLPYLRAARYRTGNPDPWTVRATLADVAERLGYPGALERVAVSRQGPSGRAAEVRLDGAAGPMVLDGRLVSRRLGLRSTLFTVAVEKSAPAAAALPQAAPESPASPVTGAAVARPDLVRVVASHPLPLPADRHGGVPPLPVAGAAAAAGGLWAEIARRRARRVRSAAVA